MTPGNAPPAQQEPAPAARPVSASALRLRQLYQRLVSALQIFSGLLLLAMTALVLVGIFYRYVLDDALSWYDEFAGYILIWLTMYGSVLALAKRKHISFETLVEKLSPRRQRIAEVVGIVLVMSFSLVLVVAGWQLIVGMADETAISVPQLRMAWIYSVMPISGGLMFLVGVIQLVQALTPGRSPSDARARPMEEAQ
jgi:TRAP-type C4-dicarboxylate transport system permease small subunit